MPRRRVDWKSLHQESFYSNIKYVIENGGLLARFGLFNLSLFELLSQYIYESRIMFIYSSSRVWKLISLFARCTFRSVINFKDGVTYCYYFLFYLISWYGMLTNNHGFKWCKTLVG